MTGISVAITGKSPTMKTLERRHDVLIGWIHERVRKGSYNVIHTRTDHMTADICTKPFTDVNLWKRFCMFANVYFLQENHDSNFNPDNSWIEEKP